MGRYVGAYITSGVVTFTVGMLGYFVRGWFSNLVTAVEDTTRHVGRLSERIALLEGWQMAVTHTRRADDSPYKTTPVDG